MSKINHPYFGELDTGSVDSGDAEVIWEQALPLAGMLAKANLWAASGKPLNAPRLDAFSARLKDLPILDGAARQQLGLYLEADRYFLEFHIEELPEQCPEQDLSLIKALAPQGDASTVEIGDFLKAMRLESVSLYASQPDSWLENDTEDYTIVMDYVFGTGFGDQILAVKFTEEGEFISVNWES